MVPTVPQLWYQQYHNYGTNSATTMAPTVPQLWQQFGSNYYEADGIVPFVANSPFVSFFYAKEAPEYNDYRNFVVLNNNTRMPGARPW